MNTRNHELEGPESRLAGLVKGAIVCLLIFGAVVVGSGMQRQNAIAADAPASAAADENWTTGYFPALFPAPQGAVEPHIDQF